MKRLVLVLLSVIFAFVTYAQNTDLGVNSLKNTTDAYIDVQGDNERSYVWFYGAAVDSVTNNDSLWGYTVTLIKDFADDLKYEARIKLDSVSGSPSVALALQGKYSWNDSWTSLTTASWAGTSSDTTVNLSYATAKNYRFLRVYLDATATAQKSKVSRVEIGVYD